MENDFELRVRVTQTTRSLFHVKLLLKKIYKEMKVKVSNFT